MKPSDSKSARARTGEASARGTAPTLAEMDIPLSFTTTTSGRAWAPALLRASKVSPPVSDPSPTMATARPGDAVRARASAIPRATLIAVQAWPAPKASSALSLGSRKGATPPSCRRVCIRSPRPERSLWA